MIIEINNFTVTVSKCKTLFAQASISTTKLIKGNRLKNISHRSKGDIDRNLFNNATTKPIKISKTRVTA
jgi:hypothetical protein